MVFNRAEASAWDIPFRGSVEVERLETETDEDVSEVVE
jgi:hypothetical protein